MRKINSIGKLVECHIPPREGEVELAIRSMQVMLKTYDPDGWEKRVSQAGADALGTLIARLETLPGRGSHSINLDEILMKHLMEALDSMTGEGVYFGRRREHPEQIGCWDTGIHGSVKGD